MITPAPFYGRYELAKRQEDVVTAIAGPDNTCGFFGGRPGEIVYAPCSTGSSMSTISPSSARRRKRIYKKDEERHESLR